jgi:hypothetical protein
VGAHPHGGRDVRVVKLCVGEGAVKTRTMRLGPVLAAGVFVGIGVLSASDGYAWTVDVYQNMESVNESGVLTPEIMNASSHGGNGIDAAWTYNNGLTFTISTQYARSFSVPVVVNGTTYSGTGTRSWEYRNREEDRYAVGKLSPNMDARLTGKGTIGCFYTTEQSEPKKLDNQHDTVEWGVSNSFAVIQTVPGNPKTGHPYIRAHSATSGYVTTFSQQRIKLSAGKTYWVNLHYDGVEGKVKVAAFDPDNGFAEVGTVIADSTAGGQLMSRVHFGNCSPHGDGPNNDSLAYFSQVVIDYTSGRFPLLPGDIPVPTDATLPVISDVRAVNVFYTSATVAWTTENPAYSRVDYGTTDPSGQYITDGDYVTSRLLVLTGLTPGTTYHYRVRSVNKSERESMFDSVPFLTKGGTVPPDAIPPVISNAQVTSIGSSSAAVIWTTDEGATGQVEYGPTVPYNRTTAVDGVYRTSHTRPLSGLEPDTLYHYRVRSRDQAGNEAVSGDAAFRTASGPTPPVIPDETPGLREAYVYPNPVTGGGDAVIKADLGDVEMVEVTIFDSAGRLAHSAAVAGGGDYVWTGAKVSGTYFAVIHGRTARGKTVKARCRFAVLR